MLKEFKCLKFDGGAILESKHEVVKEEPLSIFINGRHFVTAMISPQMKKEFVIGHLFSEGILEGLEGIESLEIEEDVAKVITTNPLKMLITKKLIVSGYGGSSSFLDESKLPKVNSNLKIDEDAIVEGVKAISESDLHKITGGVHTIGLFNESGVICLLEDIGRHNALDKIIGYGLIEEIEFEKTFVTCTGRISSDMALKCSRANIPIITSRGATTSLAIEIAEKTGLTIIAFARGRKMNVYINKQRIRMNSPIPKHR